MYIQVKQHQKKKRKEAKKRGKLPGSSKAKAARKDPGIPSTWPMKDDLLKEMQMQVWICLFIPEKMSVAADFSLRLLPHPQ